MTIKRKPITENQSKLLDDNYAIISSKDAFDPKTNPTLRLDAEFHIKQQKIREQMKKTKSKSELKKLQKELENIK